MAGSATQSTSLFQFPAAPDTGSGTDEPSISLLGPQGLVQRWSWARLDHKSKQYGGTLSQHFPGAPGRVVLMADNSPAWLAVADACWQGNIVCIVLSPDFAIALVLAIVKQLQADLVILGRAQAEHWQPVFHNADILCAVLDDEAQSGLMFSAAKTEKCAEKRQVESQLLCPDGEPAALVFHSSGSAGVPKAIVYSKASLQTFLNTQQMLFRCFEDQETRPGLAPWINVMPMAHLGGLSFCLQALRAGRTLFLGSAHYPEVLASVIVNSGIEFLLMVPSQFRRLLDCLALLQGHRIRHCLLMGENPTASLLEDAARLLGIKTYSAYGMSECLTGLLHTPNATGELPRGSCGTRGFGELKLLDSQGEPARDMGELWVRNVTTTPCYLDPVLNAGKYRDGWYRTGDCLSCDAQGNYFYQGRMDEMVVINGRNLYPHEVENLINQHPAVAESLAAVFSVNEQIKLGLLVVLHPQRIARVEELMDFYLARGALFATPGWLLFCRTLPRLASGKLDRVSAAIALGQAYSAQVHTGDFGQ